MCLYEHMNNYSYVGGKIMSNVVKKPWMRTLSFMVMVALLATTNMPIEAAAKKYVKGLKVAKTDFSVLITGETGTGKELIAKSIHIESNRANEPIVCVNCGAIPMELMESEMFGYEEGAFTSARKGGKVGKFQLANHGTLFLDEIGDLPLPLQVKLLRVLQEHEIERVGGTKPIPVDVRIIAATRKNLQQMMEEGTFRADLYYRLAVVTIDTIPLREHPDDIMLYANMFLQQLNLKFKTNVIFSSSAKRCLLKYNWPGNVRELDNVIFRIL